MLAQKKHKKSCAGSGKQEEDMFSDVLEDLREVFNHYVVHEDQPFGPFWL